MNVAPPTILALPFEVLFIITQYVTDPCDLLELRCSCSTFNDLLKKQFDLDFRSRPCMRSSSLDKIIYWAATHNYVRFAERTLGRIEWTKSDDTTMLMLHSGDRASLSYSGVEQAMYQAARCGHIEIFDYLKLVVSGGFRIYVLGNSLERKCFDVAVSEGNTEFLKRLIDDLNFSELDCTNPEGKTGLVLLMETHNVELVEHLLSYPISFGNLSNALMAYVHSLKGHREGWCQRILSTVLDSVLDPVSVFGGRGYMTDDVWLIDSKVLLDSLCRAGKRRCKAECSVWDWRQMEIELQDVEDRLRVISGIHR